MQPVTRACAVIVGAALLTGCGAPRSPDGAVPELPTQIVSRPADPPPIEAGQAPPPGPYAPGFDAVAYEVALVLPDTGTTIEGRALARIALVPPRADTLTLDLTGLAVERVRVDGATVDFAHADGRLRVPVPPAAGPGDTLSIEVVYGGEPDDGLIIGENVHGRRTVFADNWPNRARYWFPSIDHPSDKASIAFAVAAPERWRVIANGLRSIRGPAEPDPAVRALLDAGDRRWSFWQTDAPIPTYTMVIGAGELEVDRIGEACRRAGGWRVLPPLPVDSFPPGEPANEQTAREGCIPVTSWVFPPDTAHARSVFRRAPEMVAFYGDLVADFPYEKLAHVQASTRFGGMENVGAIFYSEQAIAAGRDIEGTVAHETAHQWFGDAATEADWNHLWLSEGFATYFGALFFEHADGVERFREIMESNRRRYVESGVAGRPIVDPAEDDLFALLNANNYQKGAWVLHMLRGQLGGETFFEGVRRYYERHAHGTALTHDLRTALESVAGRDLTWFFDQWVFEPGHPRLEIDWSWDGAAGAATVELRQVQPADWPTFRTPLTLEFESPAGTVRRTVDLAGRRQSARFELPGRPTGLRVDPDGWLLAEIVRVERTGG